MCSVNYSYDDLVKEFEPYGDDVDINESDYDEVQDTWFVICEGEVVAEADSKAEAVEYVKQAVSEDVELFGTAKKYKIEQSDF